MKYLLDTNIIIAIALNDNEGVVNRAGQCEEGELAMSAISLAELTYGSVQGKPPDLARLDLLLNEIAVLNFDESAARAYATLNLRRNSYDRLIAAHALSLGLTVVTSNVADFSDVPGLAIENWTK